MFLAIHPPIILENLLPCKGIFEIIHATQKRILWSSIIEAGASKSIHTVTLEEPLILQIHLKYCKSSDGLLIHQPKRMENLDGLASKISDKIHRTFGNFLDENISNDVSEDISSSSIVLTDTVGQRITLCIENICGSGGQRQITVYCPYWIVNTSQYSLRIMEEGPSLYPAGTVTTHK